MAVLKTSKVDIVLQGLEKARNSMCNIVNVEDLSPICQLPITSVVLGDDIKYDVLFCSVSKHISLDLYDLKRPVENMLIKDKVTGGVCKIIKINPDLDKVVVFNVDSGNVTADLSLDTIYDDFVSLGMDLYITDVIKWLGDNEYFHNMRSVDIDGFVRNKWGDVSSAFKIDFKNPFLKNQDIQFLYFLGGVISNKEKNGRNR